MDLLSPARLALAGDRADATAGVPAADRVAAAGGTGSAAGGSTAGPVTVAGR